MLIRKIVLAGTVSVAIACMFIALPATAQAQSCPSAEAVCGYYHPGSMVTGGCEGEDCFEMSFAESLRLVATDDRGDFPLVWNLWIYFDEGVSALGCDLRFNPGNNGKCKLEITGEFGPRCRVDVEAGDYTYYHHIGANPDLPCLGWVECRVLN